MLTALFVSCSSDDDNTDPNNGNGNNGMIDEKILGKWKVEYSKTIKPAVYNETTGKVEYDEKEAKITEYDGNYTNDQTIPKSGMFSSDEIAIEIKNNNTINVSLAGVIKPKEISYKIEDETLKWISTDPSYFFSANHKYYFEGKILIIERMPQDKINEYTISRYSKITE